MIRKAQIRFICTIMGILLLVFLCIFGVSCYFLRKSCTNAIFDKLINIEKFYDINSKSDNSLVVLIKNINDESSKKYQVLYNSAGFSDELILEIVNRSLSYKKEMPELSAGSFNNIYFSIQPSPNGLILTASDMTSMFVDLRANIVKLGIWFIIIFVLLTLCVWGISFKVFEPIADTIKKQQRFISDASHELKTPVAVISANADVIKTTENSKYLESIKLQTKRLNTLVTDLLCLAKTEENSHNIIKKDFSLSDTILEVALPFDAVAFENGKTLILDIEPNILANADRESVKKIVNILLDNAIKYSSKNGTIKVSLKNKTITVFNTGSEINKEDSDKIFERFYRGDSSRSSDLSGSGLGLSIAKSIANSNKWKLFAKSIKGESMTITLII